MPKKLTIHLTLTVETALSVGAGGTSGIMADKAIIRTQLGELLLPGSQLKGRLRHACEILATSFGLAICQSPRPENMCPHAADVSAPCVICQLFGSPSFPGPLAFSDLIYTELIGEDSTRPPSIRPGVSINRRRGTAEEQRLFYIETSPPGGYVYFNRHDGAIIGYLPDAHAEPLTKLLLAGIAYVQNWGGGKSRGLGWTSTVAQARLGNSLIELNELSAALDSLHGINRGVHAS